MPTGRAPLSRSSSHSYPSVPELRVATPPVRSATRVFCQKRRRAIEAGTLIAVVPELTVQIVPVTPFSGRPPSAGGLKRGSRHVAVQIGLPAAFNAGSIFVAASDSV